MKEEISFQAMAVICDVGKAPDHQEFIHLCIPGQGAELVLKGSMLPESFTKDVAKLLFQEDVRVRIVIEQTEKPQPAKQQPCGAPGCEAPVYAENRCWNHFRDSQR